MWQLRHQSFRYTINTPNNVVTRLCSNTTDKAKTIKECRDVLGLTESYTATDLKDSFLKLAKLYHPDSDAKHADAAKFAEVESAYKMLKQVSVENDSDTFDDVYQTLEKDFRIKHTVQQHRQFLGFGGVGYGTPSHRQRHYDLHKANQAIQNVQEHQIKKVNVIREKDLIGRDAALARQYKTQQAMERLVEDLIQASMARGEFDNLPGSGKPLKKLPDNPYVDTTTHKLNQILISSGFTPPWIVLGKEIREERSFIRNELRKRRMALGEEPVNDKEVSVWIRTLDDLKELVLELNGKINRFNMIVPTLNKQQLHFQFESEAKKILKEHVDGSTKEKVNSETGIRSIQNEQPEKWFSQILKILK